LLIPVSGKRGGNFRGGRGGGGMNGGMKGFGGGGQGRMRGMQRVLQTGKHPKTLVQ
jgi:hypothetical protein